MANIVTSIVTELLPNWMERRAKRERGKPAAPLQQTAPSHIADRTRPTADAAVRVYKPKSPPSHWRASSM